MLKCRVYVRIFEANQLSGEISPESENLIIILTPTAMTAGSPVTFGPAKPVIHRPETEVQGPRMTGLMNEMSISVPEPKETLLMAHFCAIADDNAENGTEAEPRA